MKKLFQAIVFGLFALTFNMAAIAADKGSAEEATALVKKAVAYLKANGREKAFAEFNSPSGQFKDRDLYIFINDMNGKMLVQGANSKLIGKNLIDIKDVDGKYFIKDLIELASSKGKGWVDYKWPNPVTKAVEQKSTYVEKVDDIVIGCGIYK
jgi:signal transduction histidine kinase